MHLGARLATSHLDEEAAALDGVDEDVAGREHGIVRPGAEVVDGGTAAGEGVILGVDVEESNLDEGSCEQRASISWESFEITYLADTVTSRVGGDRRDVINAEASLVAALVNKTI